MNKNIIYIAIAVLVGLLGGWLIFGGSSDDSISNMSDHDHSGENVGQMWTCSMHPQIMQPEPGDCPICGMDLIPAESNDEGMAMGQFKMTKNAMALANVRTTTVGSGTSGDNTLKLS
jgi:Cu(I)/Ag(I) efflux system membrane fusion protein